MVSPVKKTRSHLDTSLTETHKYVCFFYDSFLYCQICPGEVDVADPNFRRASTKNSSDHVKKCAHTLQHSSLLATLATSDMFSLGAVYKLPCLTALYNEERAYERTTISDENVNDVQRDYAASIALVELVSHIEDSKESSLTHVLELSTLYGMYCARVHQIKTNSNHGGHSSDKCNSHSKKTRLSEYIVKPTDYNGQKYKTDTFNTYVPPRTQHHNRTRLKEILGAIPDHTAEHNVNNRVLFAFKNDLGSCMRAASQQHMEDELLVLSWAAKICRQNLFTSEPIFQGTLPDGCSTDTSAKSLLRLLDMILRGPDIKGELKDDTRSQIIHGIAQLIKYNSVNYSQANATRTKHNIERETALPTYIELMIYSMSRNKKAVNKLH